MRAPDINRGKKEYLTWTDGVFFWLHSDLFFYLFLKLIIYLFKIRLQELSMLIATILLSRNVRNIPSTFRGAGLNSSLKPSGVLVVPRLKKWKGTPGGAGEMVGSGCASCFLFVF